MCCLHFTIIGSGLDRVPPPTRSSSIVREKIRFGAVIPDSRQVGRSNQEALAYLLLPKGAMLSREAMNKQVIKEFAEPGSGLFASRTMI